MESYSNNQLMGVNLEYGIENSQVLGHTNGQIEQQTTNKMQGKLNEQVMGSSTEMEITNETTPLTRKTRKIFKKYDRESSWRLTQGRPVNGRNIPLPGIDINHPAPRTIDWQRSKWSNRAVDIDRNNGTSNNNCINSNISDNYKVFGEYLKKKFTRGPNAKGSLQGDFIKHKSLPLPEQVFKERKPQLVIAPPKIEWQDDEFDDFFSEEEDIDYKKKEKVFKYEPKDFLKKIEYVGKDNSQWPTLVPYMVLTPKKDVEVKKRVQKKIREQIRLVKKEQTNLMENNRAQMEVVKEKHYSYVSYGTSEIIRIIYQGKKPKDAKEVDAFWATGFNAGQSISKENFRDIFRVQEPIWWECSQGVFTKCKEPTITVLEEKSFSFIPKMVSKTMENINLAADEVREAVSSVKEKVSTTAGQIQTTLDLSLFLVDIRSLYIDMEHIFDNPEISFLDKLGRLVFYLDHFYMKFGKHFSYKLEEKQENRAQSLVPTLVGFIGAIFESLGLKDTHFSIFSRFNTLDTFIIKIKQRFSFIFELIRYVIEFISKCFDTPQILEWYDKVTGLGLKKFIDNTNIMLQTPIAELINNQKKQHLELLIKEAEDIVILAGLGGWRQYGFLKSKVEQLSALQDLVFKTEQDSFGRLTPFCICISGESQIGKSQLVREIAGCLIPPSIPLEKRIYTRGATDHYDGYTGQYCIVVDDWAARIDTDWSELLQWITCETTVLPMASLESKTVGKKGTTCQAKLIILTTNTSYPPMDNSMFNRSAVLKRRHVLLEARRTTTASYDDFSHLRFMLKHSEIDKDMLSNYISLQDVKILLQDRFQTHYETELRLLERRKEMVLNPGYGMLSNEDSNNAARLLAVRPDLVLENEKEEEQPGTSGTNRAQFLEYVNELYGIGQHALSGTVSGEKHLIGLFRSLAKGYGLVYLINGMTGMYNSYKYGASAIGPLINTLGGIVILMSIKSMDQTKELITYDIDKVLVRSSLSQKDRAWIVKMYNLREELSQAKKDAEDGDVSINLERLDKALRTMDLLPHWKEIGEAESNNLNKDGVRRRNRKKAEGEIIELAESSNLNKDGVRRRKNRRAEVLSYTLPRPFNDEKFIPKTLGLNYITHYAAFLRETGRNHLLEKDIYIDFTTKWSEALQFCDTVYEVIDYINDGKKPEYKAKKNETLLPKPEEDYIFKDHIDAIRYLGDYIDFLTEEGFEDWLSVGFIDDLTQRWAKVASENRSLFNLVDALNGVGKSEASGDLNCDTLAEQILKNVVKFHKVKDGEVIAALNAINLKGSLFLLPYHFFLRNGGHLDHGFSIKITNGFIYDNNTYGTTGSLTIPFNLNDLVVGSSSLDRKDDWCLYDAGRSWAPGKNIFSYFATNEDLKFITSAPAMLVLKDPMRVYHHTTVSPNDMTSYTMDDDGGGRFTLVRSWQYKANTKYGDCGAPLLVRDNRLPRKIIGMHISGVSGTDFAYSVVLTQEKIKSLLPNVAQGCVLPELDLEKMHRHIMFNNFEYVGSVPKSKQVVSANETTIRESLIHDLFEKKKFPAVLDLNDPRYEGEQDILEKQQDKYTGLRVDLENQLLKEIVEDIVKEHSIDTKYPRPILTEEQMLNGYDTLPRVDPHTSAGYPYSTGWYKKEKNLPTLNGKETYLELVDNQWRYRSPIMRTIVEYREEQARKLQRIPSFWTASLKDETLGMNKITTGNTRLFMNPPMDFTLLLRKYTGAFSSFVFKHNIDLGCAAGFNPESGAWTRLAYKLLGVNERVGALDYTWFDGSLGAQLIFGALDIINKWYNGSEEDNNVRTTLFHEIVFSYILVRREVYLKMKGNPSGNALTMVMNNLVSKILLRVYWMVLAPVNWRDCALFSQNVVSFVCGDDNIFAVPPEFEEFFGGENIIKVAGTIGLTATSERKDKTSVYKLLWETTFLKRGFRRDGVHIKPILDLKSIENMMIWISNSKFMTPLQCTATNVECALRYLYFWGPEVYNHYRDLLMKVSNERELNLPLVTYDYQDRIFKEVGELPNAYAQMLAPNNKQETDGYRKNHLRDLARDPVRMCKRKRQPSGCDVKSTTEQNSINCKAKVKFTPSQLYFSPRKRWTLRWEYDMGNKRTAWRSINLKVNAKMNEDKEEFAIGALSHEKQTTLEMQSTAPPTIKVNATEGILEGEINSEKRQGIIFDEQTQMTSISNTGASYNGTMEENEWNMKNFFMVPVRVASGSWATTDAVMKELKFFYLGDIHQYFSRWKNVVNQYTYYRYRIRFRLEVNGTPFHAGNLTLAWRPSELTITDRSTVKSIQHVTLNASYNTVGELETYWFEPVEYLSTENLLTMGRCGVYVFNTLTAGTGASTSVGWTLYAQLLDVKLSMPRPLTGSAQGLVNIQTITVNSSGSGNAPINTTGDTFDTKMSGLDLASNVKDPEKMFRWGLSNPFMASGNPPVDRLSAYPSGLTMATENTFNVGFDEMDIDWIKRLPGYLRTVSLTTTQAFGKVIASGPCAPMTKLTGPNSNAAYTPLHWLTSHYVNWRGDLEMCVEVVSSQYHTGKLFFGINYSATPVADFSASGVDPTTYYGKVIEINSKENCFTVTIPYQHWASWLDTMPNAGYFNGSSTVVNNNCMASHTRGNGANYYTLGEWFVAVLNPLVVPAGVSSSIDLNIYMRGGENYELHRPGFSGYRASNIAQIETIGNQKNRVDSHAVTQFVERPRSIRDLLKRAVIAERSQLLPSKGNGLPANKGCFYKQIDIDSLLKNTAPWSGILNSYNAFVGDWRVKVVMDFSGMDAAASETVFIGFSNRPNMGRSNENGFGATLDQLFPMRMSNNSTVASEIINVDNFVSSVGGAYTFGDFAACSGWETTHVVTRNCNTLELEIPYYSFLKYASTGACIPSSTRAFGYLYFMQPSNSSNEINTDMRGANVTIYFYAGDSFRCGQWLGPSTLGTVRSNVNNSRYNYLGTFGVTTVATKEAASLHDFDVVQM
nr:MAG: polyprotein [Picornavirales sp.]